jgi:hypothetical protein
MKDGVPHGTSGVNWIDLEHGEEGGKRRRSGDVDDLQPAAAADPGRRSTAAVFTVAGVRLARLDAAVASCTFAQPIQELGVVARLHIAIPAEEPGVRNVRLVLGEVRIVGFFQGLYLCSAWLVVFTCVTRVHSR